MKIKQVIESADICRVCGQTPCNCTHVTEGLRDPEDNPCWKGYHPVGTKKKNGRTVPNCVPNATEDVAEAAKPIHPELHKKLTAGGYTHVKDNIYTHPRHGKVRVSPSGPDRLGRSKNGIKPEGVRIHGRGIEAFTNDWTNKSSKFGEGVAEAQSPISAGRRAGKSGKPLAPPHPKGSKEYSEFEKGWNEKENIRKANKLAPYNKQGVAEGSLNEGQYEMMMRNGQVKKFIAKDDADAKRIAAGYGAKSVIRLRGGVPAGKVAEQGVAEGEYKSRHIHRQEQNKKYDEYCRSQEAAGKKPMSRGDWAATQRKGQKQGVAEGSSDRRKQEQEADKWLEKRIMKCTCPTSARNNPKCPVHGKKKGVAETSLKQKVKTTLRKLDPTIKGRLKDRADDEFDFGLEKDNGDWISGAPGSAHMKHAAHLRRLARGEKPFQDKKGVAEGNPVDSDGYAVDREDAGEYDYEGDQAKDQLQTIVAAARKLDGILDDNENMPEWVQMKITKATDYLDTAADYVAANKAQAEPMAEANDEKIAGRYDPADFDDMVSRLKKLAGAGPMKTVYDPQKRVYKNVPVAVQSGDKK